MHFSRGLSTHRVPYALHALNRARLVERLSREVVGASVVVLQGAVSRMRFDTDHEELTRQESFFQWAFGAKEADVFGTIDVQSGKATLFVPRLPAEFAVWMGQIRTPEDFRQSYELDDCRFIDELAASLPRDATLLLLQGKNSDSGESARPAVFEGIDRFKQDTQLLHRHMVELRMIKTPLELDVLRYAARLSSDAHRKVMQTIRPGMMEYQAEATFQHHCYHDGGARHCAYTCICAAGDNSAVLHYGHAGAPNEKQIKDGDLLLFDMGCEYHCYCADITCTFPANGKFSADQKLIYNAVLAASRAVLDTAKAGVSWLDMHRLAERVLLSKLRDGGLVVGSDEELAAHHIGALFMPHGLGHFLGLDTHDVGGWLPGMTRPTEPGIKKLRCGHILQPSMVITVEPGCYFNTALLEPAFKDDKIKKYLVEDRIRRFIGMGGVRIEDDVIVKENGVEVMSDVPRTVEDIEKFMMK